MLHFASPATLWAVVLNYYYLAVFLRAALRVPSPFLGVFFELTSGSHFVIDRFKLDMPACHVWYMLELNWYNMIMIFSPMCRASTVTIEPTANTTAWTPATTLNTPASTAVTATPGRAVDLEILINDEEM